MKGRQNMKSMTGFGRAKLEKEARCPKRGTKVTLPKAPEVVRPTKVELQLLRISKAIVSKPLWVDSFIKTTIFPL